jgi:uncharacterized protein
LGIQPWLALLVAWIGNCGFWLFCFNRVNAFGIHRPIAKALEKLCIALCFLIPASVLWSDWPTIANWLWSSKQWFPSSCSPLTTFWLAWSLATLIILGPCWLESRLWLITPKHLIETTSKNYCVHRELPDGSAQNFSTKLLSYVPLNEWAHLSVTKKTLQLPRSIPAAQGLKIGHLSDLHFTGQYRSEHYEFVLSRMQELTPELIVISGDIIDYAACLPMIRSVCKSLSAPLGVYFVLGNHDRRLKDTTSIVTILKDLGFHDLGVEDKIVCRDALKIHLIGNELPWFERHQAIQSIEEQIQHQEETTLRLGVAHTPDRINWARRNNLDLLLAGHTHGGQARIPGIGPLVAPSLYGSKFASGVFWLPPTLMHVSRGVAGTHPLRWRCTPEISLLTLVNV